MRIRKHVALAGVALFAAAVPLIAAPASATTGPSWEPDTNALGTLAFYNAAGTQVTGGSNLSHLFDYAEASTADANTGIKATLYFAQPTYGQVTGVWPTGQASASTFTPPTSAPSPLNTATNPVVTVGSTYANLQSFINQNTAQTQTGYVDVYQLRLVTTGGGGGSVNSGDYWDADVVVNTADGTWLEEYPEQGATAVGTATALQASPASSASQGASVTLTATVTANDASHPAGSMEFFQDGQSLGTGNFDAATGVATLATSALLPSAPSGTELTATFTPSDTSSYSPSTSPQLAYTVNPVATKPTLSGPHQVGGTETCNEGTIDYGVTASYAWLVGGSQKATGKTFKVPASAYKKSLACTASVKAGSGPSSSATSSSITVSLGKALKATTKPALSGPHKVGKAEKVNAGKWSPAASSYSYQWLNGKKKIKGATKASFKPSKSLKGKTISCQVTAKATGYANGTATTKGVKVS